MLAGTPLAAGGAGAGVPEVRVASLVLLAPLSHAQSAGSPPHAPAAGGGGAAGNGTGLGALLRWEGSRGCIGRGPAAGEIQRMHRERDCGGRDP